MTQKHKIMLQKLEHLTISASKAVHHYKERGDRQMTIAHLRGVKSEAEHLIATLETLHFNNLADEVEQERIMEHGNSCSKEA